MNKHTETILHFYQGDQLHTALGAASSRTLLRTQEQPLAEQEHQPGRSNTKLLTTDAQGSVLQTHAGHDAASFSYTAFGHSPRDEAANALAGFNGENCDPQTGCYLLGNGYRAYNPIIKRFNSPDNLSPFGEGGINAFTYCAGDPVNYTDPTGHMIYYRGAGRYSPYPGANRLVPESMSLSRSPAPPSTPRPQPSAVTPRPYTPATSSTMLVAHASSHTARKATTSQSPSAIPPVPSTQPATRAKNSSWKALANELGWKNKYDIEEFLNTRKLSPKSMHKDQFTREMVDYIDWQIQYPDAMQRNIRKEITKASQSLRARLSKEYESRIQK
ncbi:MAG TPA: RHS repeat-associated core domain-containing protein [Pseudomonas sp.]|uniref:RHS repeat-associated core domain-containing protein n=1 Tax=Pseudomonas sp. TaxID=306 RepID=UPI002B47B48A|nr:RHS repeat-associated core domain-containing protein [Pseudomonas sp.]HKS11588.1 RHS repeat-associated core domain-containing protein [Pseudomonas sp.]